MGFNSGFKGLITSGVDKTPADPAAPHSKGPPNVQVNKICRWFAYFWQKVVFSIPVMRPRSNWRLRPSGILRCLCWWLVTDVSGQHISPILKGQGGENGTKRVIPLTSVTNCRPTPLTSQKVEDFNYTADEAWNLTAGSDFANNYMAFPPPVFNTTHS